MRRVFLLRHGRTEANEKRLYCGVSDVPLSDAGRAELVKLRETTHYPDLSGLRVYTSGLLRTEETLSFLFGETPHEKVPELREMDFGDFEMCCYDELKTKPAYIAWIDTYSDQKRCPNGESGADMTRRVLAAFDVLLRQNEDFLAISHGGPISAIMANLFPEAGKNHYEWQPENGRGYLVEFDGTRPLRFVPIPETTDER